MQYDTKPEITIIVPDSVQKSDGTWTIPFENEIEKIYRGYRQCYTKEPFKDKELSRTDYQELKLEALKYDDILFDLGVQYETYEQRFEKYGEKNYLDFFKKCKFINEHRNHESQLEHGVVSVRIAGCDRSFSHQWTRSRIASHGQQSQRFVKEDDLKIITPPSIQRNKKAFRVFKGYLDQLPQVIQALREENIPNEDIRAVFPNATETQIVTTCNFREWLHIFEERCCSKAQWHIRDVAYRIQNYLMYEIPLIFHPMYGAGAKCTKLGYCPETKPCGRAPSKKEIFNKK